MLSTTIPDVVLPGELDDPHRKATSPLPPCVEGGIHGIGDKAKGSPIAPSNGAA